MYAKIIFLDKRLSNLSQAIHNKTKKLLTALRDLHIEGGFRMMNWEANLCWEKMGGSSGSYYDLAEIVLIKISSQTECFFR